MPDLPIRLPAFRQWVDDIREMLDHLMEGVKPPDRPLTPVLFLMDDQARQEMTPVEADFFGPEELARNALLSLATALAAAHRAQRIAWTLDVMVEEDGREVESVMVVAMDREVHEVWGAPVERRPGQQPIVGHWDQWAANTATGDLITPIQEALR